MFKMGRFEEIDSYMKDNSLKRDKRFFTNIIRRSKAKVKIRNKS